MMKQNPFPEKRREREEGRQAPGTRRNQEILMEQNPFPEDRKKIGEGRQAPEPKKREKGRQTPEPQPEPGANHDGTEPLS